LQNSSIRHSGLDPESRKYLIILDSRLRGNDKNGPKLTFYEIIKAGGIEIEDFLFWYFLDLSVWA